MCGRKKKGDDQKRVLGEGEKQKESGGRNRKWTTEKTVEEKKRKD